MTITAQVPTVTVLANGTTTVFNFPFEVPYQDDGSTPALQVQVEGAIIDPSLYTAVGVGNETGGHINYPLTGPPLSFGNHVAMTRTLAYSQGVAFANDSPPLPTAIEEMGDRLEMQIQQLTLESASAQGVTSFNGRTGAVTLDSGDVTTALGYTPVSTNVLGVDNGVATLGSDGILTMAQRPPGGGSFDQNTAYVLGSTTAPLSLVERGEEVVNVKDYGATGDGTTDDTAAFNNAIAAINAGAPPCLYMPAGNYLISGNTTTITVGCSIIGAGLSATAILAGSGTSPIFNLTPAGDTHYKGHLDFRNFTLSGQHLYTRHAIDISWAVSTVSQQMRCYMTNIDIQPGFTGGIALNNSIFPVFNAVQVNGGSATAPYLCLYGWHFTADTGNYTLGPFMTNCASASVGKSIWVEDHCEGICILGGCHVFVDYAFYIDVSMTTGGPENHIADVQTEVNIQSVYVANMAYIHIHDCSFYNHDTATNAIQLHNCLYSFVHSNQVIQGSAAGTGVCTGVLLSGTTNAVKVYDNHFAFVANVYCIGNQDTADYNHIYNNSFFGILNSGARPYQITTPGSGVHNQVKGHYCADASSLALVAFSGVIRAGFTGGTTGPTPVDTFVQFLQAGGSGGFPMWSGELWRITAQVNYNAPSADTVVLARCREFNHRPSAPSPYHVFEFANNGTTLVQSCFIPNANSGSSVFEVTVTVIANAVDALPVIDISTSAGTLQVTSVELTVQRL